MVTKLKCEFFIENHSNYGGEWYKGFIIGFSEDYSKNKSYALISDLKGKPFKIVFNESHIKLIDIEKN